MAQTGGNTKTPVKNRKWCFTLNNYTEEDWNSIIKHVTQNTCSYIIAKEVGKKKSTPHLQGYINYRNARTFTSMQKNIVGAHLEVAKGNDLQNREYCSKDGDYVTNIKHKFENVLEKEYNNITWKPWQQDILNLIKEEPDSRTVNWFWDRQGDIGKSYLAKYIAIIHDAVIGEGKTDNIFNEVFNHIDEKKSDPRVVIVDIPRKDRNSVNYPVIEKLKNGLIYSGKYKGGICIFPHPHIIVFCNEPPMEDSMSEDRWNIVELETKKIK